MPEDLTQSKLKELLDYDPETGVFKWSESRRRPFRGRKAGYLSSEGYRLITVSGREYLAHRVAWLFSHGEWPQHTVDHKNQIKDDNRLKNLRLATQSQNSCNRPNSRPAQSGVRGVRETSSGRYSVRIKFSGKLKSYGTFDTIEEADERAREVRKSLHGEFYYDDRRGTR